MSKEYTRNDLVVGQLIVFITKVSVKDKYVFGLGEIIYVFDQFFIIQPEDQVKKLVYYNQIVEDEFMDKANFECMVVTIDGEPVMYRQEPKPFRLPTDYNPSIALLNQTPPLTYSSSTKVNNLNMDSIQVPSPASLEEKEAFLRELETNEPAEMRDLMDVGGKTLVINVGGTTPPQPPEPAPLRGEEPPKLERPQGTIDDGGSFTSAAKDIVKNPKVFALFLSGLAVIAIVAIAVMTQQ